jgi:hypothetical protein
MFGECKKIVKSLKAIHRFHMRHLPAPAAGMRAKSVDKLFTGFLYFGLGLRFCGRGDESRGVVTGLPVE